MVASDQEAAEFRAHDKAVRAEMQAQEMADREAYNQHEASLAQRWDDWAIITSELNRPHQAPSRKRVRVTVCAGTGSGNDIGEACVEGVIDHDQQATISFNVLETLLGGLGQATSGSTVMGSHANPQLAKYARDPTRTTCDGSRLLVFPGRSSLVVEVQCGHGQREHGCREIWS